MDLIPPPETLVSNTSRLFCDGDERGGDGHPRVWLQMPPTGFVDCPYCDRRFILAGGPAHTEAGAASPVALPVSPLPADAPLVADTGDLPLVASPADLPAGDRSVA